MSAKSAASLFELARRKRNVAIALALGGMVVLFFVMTIVRLGGHVVEVFQ